MNILLIVPYPKNQAPSQRFRIEHFLDDFEKANITYQYEPFINESTWKVLYQSKNSFKKLVGIINGFLNRIRLLFKLKKYDYVYLHREASPLGPPVFEFIIAKILKKKIIYDFDDAIWLPNTSQQNKIAASLKWHHKVASICKWSYKISCGNGYLAEYAKRFNENVFIIPTVVETDTRHAIIKKHTEKNYPIIGWTGSHSTLPYLDELIPILKELEKNYSFEFLVIANQNPKLPLKNFRFIKWNEETEIEDLSQIDIGVMPLPNNQWTKGKCGFKAIQYMALGIPAVVSPVSVNKKIVNHQINGFLCENESDWKNTLTQLLINSSLREKMGISAREKIKSDYSVSAIKDDFFSLFS